MRAHRARLPTSSSLPGGGVRLATLTRASNAALLEKMLAAHVGCGHPARDRDLTRPARPDKQRSRARRIPGGAGGQAYRCPSDLRRDASEPYRGGGSRRGRRGRCAVSNDATQNVQGVRAQADADMAAGVDKLNGLLAQFGSTNAAIVNGTRQDTDVTDYLDQRDQLLAAISEQVGVRTVTRSDNDMAIYTDSGVTLFDTRARAVTFDKTPIYTPASVGKPVYVDGVPITGGSGSMLSGSAGLQGSPPCATIWPSPIKVSSMRLRAD